MMEEIGKYLLSVSACAVLVSFVQNIIMSKPVQKYAGLAGGLLLLVVVVSPLVRLDDSTLTEISNHYETYCQVDTSEQQEQNRQVLESIISERCETYIWDKANQMGVSIDVDVFLCDEGYYPYPDAVRMIYSGSMQQKEVLSAWIEQELGIPLSHQEWLTG